MRISDWSSDVCSSDLPQARAAAAFTGRANLYAETAGIAVIDGARVAALNQLDEALTVATVAPWEPVEAGQMLATVKIIPFAAPRTAIERGEALLAATGDALVRVAPFQPRDIGLVLTRVPGTKDSVLTKTGQAVAGRLERKSTRLNSSN